MHDFFHFVIATEPTGEDGNLLLNQTISLAWVGWQPTLHLFVTLVG
jgi:hypothetical protein